MLTEDKVTELFYMAYDFCKFFDTMMERYTLKPNRKRHYHRNHLWMAYNLSQSLQAT